MPVLKLLCEQDSFLCLVCYKQADYTFNFLSQVKMANHYENNKFFLDIQHLLQEYVLHYYLHHNFYEVFIKFMFPSHSRSFTGSF